MDGSIIGTVHAGAHLHFPIIWTVIITTMTSVSSIIPVDLLAAATNPLYFADLITTNVSNPEKIAFLSFDERFAGEVLGKGATARRLVETEWEAFHEVNISLSRGCLVQLAFSSRQ